MVAVSADRFGNESRDASVAEVVIDTTPPAAPTVDKYAGNDSTPEIGGTWPASEASSLSLDYRRANLRAGDRSPRSPPMRTEPGNSSIAEPLRDGYYDVVATAQDAAGNESRDTSVAEVVIDTTPPAAPTVNAGYDSSRHR